MVTVNSKCIIDINLSSKNIASGFFILLSHEKTLQVYLKQKHYKTKKLEMMLP